MAKSGKRRQRAASLEPILLRIACDGLPRIQQSLAARCGGFGRFPGEPIPYNFRTAPEASRSSKLSYWFCWRSLGDSNPCFRRERATPTDCGPFSGVPSIILRSSAPELSNNMIQKGLAFIGDWSGTVVKSGRHERPESCPAGLLALVGLRWCGATPP